MIRNLSPALKSTAAVLLVFAFMLSAGAESVVSASTLPPTVHTGHVSSVLPNSAEVTGTVNPNGASTTWYFEYGLSTATTFTSKTPLKSVGSGTTDISVLASLDGLAPATSYRYRMVATNSVGTTDGGVGIFNTSAAPAVITGAASHLTASSATLNGIVNPEALATSWYFAYGTSTKYGLKTTTENLSASPNDATVTANIANLSSKTTYHFRVVATSGAGTSFGVDFTLITGLSVTLNTSISTVTYGDFAQLSGMIASGSAGSKVTLESKRFDQSAFSAIASVTTGGGGNWSYSAQPIARTTYEATVTAGTSSPTIISVRPRLFLTVVSGGRLSTRVVGSISFANHVLQLQRLSHGLWVTWKHVRLNNVAKAIFVTSLPKGRTMIRMAIGPFVPGIDQAAPGYLAGYSRTINFLR